MTSLCKRDDLTYINLAELKRKSIRDLAAMAAERRIDGAGALTRQELIFALLSERAGAGGTIRAEGVVEKLPDGFGFLRSADHNYLPGADDIYVSPSQIRRFNLRTGDTVSGVVRPPKESERYFALLRVEQINGGDPDDTDARILFDDLTPIYPRNRFALGVEPIDLLCPLGRGQRCLVVSPPRAGKSSLIRELARAICAADSRAVVTVLLIGERPEDVTEMARTASVDVIATTFEEPASRHAHVADIVLERAKRLAESGADVVLLVDSITRLARAYAALDGDAPQRTRRFFAAARKLEEAGSLTLVATAHTAAGSRTDEAILEELTGTATSEIHLSSELAAAGTYPAIDPARSFTHHAELLLDRAALARASQLRP